MRKSAACARSQLRIALLSDYGAVLATYSCKHARGVKKKVGRPWATITVELERLAALIAPWLQDKRTLSWVLSGVQVLDNIRKRNAMKT